MRLLDFISREGVSLDLPVQNREEALRALISLLNLGADIERELLPALERREDLSSTGVGRGIAVPHVRSDRVTDIKLAYGRVSDGLSWNAIDGRPVKHLFMIIAPTGAAGGAYLPLLGRLAQFAKMAGTPDKLDELDSADEFLGLLEESGY